MRESKKGLNIALAAVTGLAVALAAVGWCFGIVKMNEVKNRDTRISELEEMNSQLALELEGLETSTEAYADYLKTSNWEVMFPYADGVSTAKTETTSEFDGALYITSVTENGAKLDVNDCGGSEKYTEKKFFLGKVVRWNASASHAEGTVSPEKDGSYSKIFKTSKYDYYIYYEGGSGCEAGEDTANYKRGVELARQMIQNIRIKED